MKILFFSFLFIISFYTSQAQYSQSYLVKTNGEKIKFQSLKFKRDSIQLDFFGPNGKMMVDTKNILGYYRIKEGIMNYLIPVIDKNGEIVSNQKIFAPKILNGKIEIYKQTDYVTHVNNSVGTTYSTKKTTLIVRKNGVFKAIYSDFNSFNKNYKPYLFDIISDNQIIAKKINIKTTITSDEIIELINEYNVYSFKEPRLNINVGKNSILFYRTSNNGKEDIDILIGDDKVEFLPPNSLVNVNLIPNQHQLICFRNTIAEKCQLFETNNYVDITYQVLTNKRGAIRIEMKSKKETEHDIKLIKSISNR